MIGNNLDIIFCNKDEALAWTGVETVSEAINALTSISRTVAVTLGSEGALLFDGQKQITVAAPKVEAIDTNGAGDMFAGAFLASLCRGEDYRQAGEIACYAASQVVQQFGPRLEPDDYVALKKSFWNETQ